MDVIYRLRLLGMMQVEKKGVLLRDFESRKALALLGYLARQDQPVSRSHLAGLFWGDKEEARGRRNLSRELSQLSALLPGCFQADYHTIQFLPPDTFWVDVHIFAKLVKSGLGKSASKSSLSKTGPHSQMPKTATDWFPAHLAADIQVELLAEAVALYCGDFMTGFFLDDCPEFETWLLREQEGWRRQVTELLERLLVYYARSNQDDLALTQARRWLELEPWRERAHRYLMVLLARQDERSAALAQYEICRRALAEELAVEPSAAMVTLYEQIRSGELSREAEEQGSAGEVVSASLHPGDPLPSPSPVALHKVPTPSTPFIGREEELAQIAAHLNDPAVRLLTLIGPGGIGKTRLAIQSTWQAIQADTGLFADGVYFIPLDSLSSAEFLVATLADVLNFSFYSGANPANQLLDYLREKRLLLVLDNFEHLLAGVGLLSDILRQVPQVKILAVSRERLNLQEEYLLPIQGLKVPEPQPKLSWQRAKAPALEAYSAVQLFLQRAQTVNPGYILSEAETPCVVHVCRLTEGTPLAIELAAAWLRLLSCQEIAQEIEQNLDFLTTSLRNIPERQRSLRAVFDYSWRLLSAEEQRVFRQLAVFWGGFQLEAARQVVGAALPLLLALMDKSLLRRTETGRYTRHLLLWQYAAEKLDETPQEKEEVQALHGQYYAAFLYGKEQLLTGGQQKEALAEINIEIENVRAAWRWAVAHGDLATIEPALESLFHFYDIRSWFQEGAESFGWAATSLRDETQGNEETRGGEAEELKGTEGNSGELGEAGESDNRKSKIQNPKSKIVLGKLLARQGWFTFQLGQHEAAKALLHESLGILRSLDSAARGETIFPLNYLGAVHRHLGEYELARQLCQESMVLCREMGDTLGLSIALNILGQVAYLKGDYSRSRQLCQESLALKQGIGDRRGMTFSLNNLGQVAYALGEYPEAKAFFEESLTICQEIGDRRGIALCLSYLGDVVQMMAEYQGAKQLYQESLSIFKEIGNQWGAISARTKLGYVTSLDDIQTARDYFSEALKVALNIQAIPGALDALVGLASLLIKTGGAEREQALEILALALSHPASSRDNQDRAARLLAEVEPQFSAATVKAVRTRGQVNTLETVVRAVLSKERS
ncbi:MAG: tetratricopeptide repeat protein [Anaerolineales bacterium]|nr:tetratricopeptide repeat protein [Anaerolineales bacterium]